MSHEIAKAADGRDSFARVGEKAWHGLGQKLSEGADLDVWVSEAGLAYRIQRSVVRYATERDGQGMIELPDRHVLFRSDTKAALGVVSDGYKVVQPREVVEFFREWAQMGGAQLESAGALFDGRRYFATAKVGDSVQIGEGDWVAPYILLSSSADGSLATEARWTSIRVVCNNTLTAALSHGKGAHRVTHRSAWKPTEARAAVESANAEFSAFTSAARALSRVQVDHQRAKSLTARILKLDDAPAMEAEGKLPRGFERIMALFGGEAEGIELPGVRGTGWGYLNAVTQYVDHDIRARSDEHRFASAQDGAGARIKSAALDEVLALA